MRKLQTQIRLSIMLGVFSVFSMLLTTSSFGQRQGPNGFNKPLARQPQQSRPLIQRQPNVNNHVRPYNPGRNFYGNRGRQFNRVIFPGNNFIPFGVPFGPFHQGYANFPFGFPPSPFGATFFSSEFYQPFPMLPPGSPTELTDMNALKINQLLDRQNGVPPAAPTPNDAQPVPPGFSIAQVTTVPTEEVSKTNQLLAEAAFRNGNYIEAAGYTANAISRDRDNGFLWLFSSQTHLANGRYLEAAQDASLAMRLLPRKEWFWAIENFREFYRNSDYVNQIKALSQHIKANEKDHAARSLRAYHYLGLGYPDEAMADLTAAKALKANDEWTKQLIDYVEPILQSRKPVEQPAPAPTPSTKKSILQQDKK